MKGRFSSVWRVATALVLALSLALVTAAPAAATVSEPTVAVSPTVISDNASYTIGFTTTASLASGVGTITVTFPGDTTVPSSYATGAITVQSSNVSGGDVEVSGKIVTFKVPVTLTAPASVQVVFKTTAGIKNPSTPGSKTLEVKTSAETTGVNSAAYTIVAKPIVTSLAPNKATRGTALNVTITGNYFTAATSYNGTASAVSFNGTGITVNSFTVTNATTISAGITVDAAATGGARSVSVTNLAGTGTTASVFTVVTTGVLVDRFNSSNAYQAQTNNITAAIAAASTGDILKVQAGTDNTSVGETFPINISKALILKSYMGAASTTIDASGQGNTATLAIGNTANVTIGGSGSGFTIITSGIAGIHVPEANTNGGSGLEILYNTFKAETQGTSHGIWVEAEFKASSSTRPAKIQYNDFSQATAWVDGGLLGAPGTGIQIASAAYNQSTRSVISNNTAANQKYTWLAFKPEKWSAGEVSMTSATTVGGVDVYSNVVNGNRGRAVHFALAKHNIPENSVQSLTIHNDKVNIYKNTFYNNGEGVKIDAAIVDAYGDTSLDADITTEENIIINYNDIYSNTNTAWSAATQKGINNGQTTAVKAQYNWWGNKGGPGGEGMGLGDNVTTYVTYDPWLTKIYATVISDGIRSYGSDAIELAVGWNTLSVPTGLTTSADNFSEILAMGTYIDSDHYVGGYWYNTQTGAWVSIENSTQLVPGKGYYIKMSTASRFPVLYFDGSLNLPSYSVYSGWNLIGAMFGVDGGSGDFGVAATGSTNGKKTPLLALDSISSKASVVISPSVPGQVSSWSALASDNTLFMQVGEAYWVFLTADGTLAGYEVTPYYFTWSAP